MIDFLTSIGFYAFKSCGCNGGEASLRHREPEKMIGIVVFVKKRSNSYEIKRNGTVINRGQGFQLETEYNKLFA